VKPIEISGIRAVSEAIQRAIFQLYSKDKNMFINIKNNNTEMREEQENSGKNI
jgi:hypothetical protein